MHRPSPPTEFLLWLDRFLGTWECDGQRYTVDRRADGWLKAESSGGKRASLQRLLANGRQVEPAPSPLGMYPVVLSQGLMRLWLKPKEFDRLREAWRVSSGMRLILATIERNIRESDEATRREKFGAMWTAGRGRRRAWTKEDVAVCKTLMEAYDSERRGGRTSRGAGPSPRRYLATIRAP
jgi:hypothetical protein